MDKLQITGENRLAGEVIISGAKNAVLPIMTASLLLAEPVFLTNVPNLQDVRTLLQLFQMIGANSDFNNGNLIIDAKNVDKPIADYQLVKTMRASILVMAPLLARFGYARVSLPGGCAIGARPVDQHLKALKQMGAEVNLIDGYIEVKANQLTGAEINFDMVTVTGTENILMAAVLAKGITILKNVALEPEVSDLANFLNLCGAKIRGIGTDCLIVEGVRSLHPPKKSYAILPDRIEAGTYLIAGIVTKGQVVARNVHVYLLQSVLNLLQKAGANIKNGNDFIEVIAPKSLTAVDFTTKPFPDIPTDMQAQLMAMNCVADGCAIVKESVFENRFMHIPELIRMGANISISNNTATIVGKNQLTGAKVMATDLRASASLVIAGLAAKGETLIDRIYHLDRGYENLEQKLTTLGAKVIRIKGNGSN